MLTKIIPVLIGMSISCRRKTEMYSGNRLKDQVIRGRRKTARAAGLTSMRNGYPGAGLSPGNHENCGAPRFLRFKGITHRHSLL